MLVATNHQRHLIGQPYHRNRTTKTTIKKLRGDVVETTTLSTLYNNSGCLLKFQRFQLIIRKASCVKAHSLELL